MLLLTFAHKGEAQVFFQYEEYQSVPFPFPGLYRHPDYFLLITGEGVWNANAKVSAVCSAFASEIKEVINMGIAGSLNSNQTFLDHIYPIRTVYKESENPHSLMDYTSYTSSNNSGSSETPSLIDCLTSHKRVLTAETAKALSPFAPLVDRELWGIAHGARLFNLPFRAFKLVSDNPTEKQELSLCSQIELKTPQLSEQLYEYFKVHLKKTTQTLPVPENISTELEEFFAAPDFYWTTQQKRLFHSHLKILKIKNPAILNQLPSLSQKTKDEIILPKKRAQHILDYLHQNISPVMNRLKTDLQEICQTLEQAQIHVQFSKDYATDELHLTTTLKNQQHLGQVILSLQEFPYLKVLDLLHGGLEL